MREVRVAARKKTSYARQKDINRCMEGKECVHLGLLEQLKKNM